MCEYRISKVGWHRDRVWVRVVRGNGGPYTIESDVSRGKWINRVRTTAIDDKGSDVI